MERVDIVRIASERPEPEIDRVIDTAREERKRKKRFS